nr:hypothetical protein [Phocaeicola vulgatus]
MDRYLYWRGKRIKSANGNFFKTYSAYQDNPASLDGTSSYAIFKDRKERIWITSMSGVNLYNREKIISPELKTWTH